MHILSDLLNSLSLALQQSHGFLSRVKQRCNNSWRVTRPDCQRWRHVDSPGGEPTEGSVSLPWQLLAKSFVDGRWSRLFQSAPVSRRHVFGTGASPRVSKGRRQTSPPFPLAARPVSQGSLTSAHSPLRGPEAGGYVLIDESGGLVSISTNYDECLDVCGISECRCVKLTLINPFVYFSCFSGV